MKLKIEIVVFFLVSILSVGIADALESNDARQGGSCIKIFGLYLTLPSRYLIHPASPSLDTNTLFTLSCLGPPDCTFGSSPASFIEGPGTVSMAIGKNPASIVKELSDNNSFNLVSETKSKYELQTKIYQRVGNNGAELMYDKYVSLIYDEQHYVFILSERKREGAFFIDRLSTNSSCF